MAKRCASSSNGAHGCFGRQLEDYYQRWKSRKETSKQRLPFLTFFTYRSSSDPSPKSSLSSSASCRDMVIIPLPYLSRLHQWVRNRRRQESRQDRGWAKRQTEQVRSNFSQVRLKAEKLRKVHFPNSSLQTVRVRNSHHNIRHHGPRRGQEKAHRWQGTRIFLLSAWKDVELDSKG